MPVEKLSSGARALKQREVDPISMTFRDPIREQERLNLRTATLDAKKNAYLDAKSTQRNIILNTTSTNQMKQYVNNNFCFFFIFLFIYLFIYLFIFNSKSNTCGLIPF